MSNKEDNLKEKFKIALNSTAKVISDNYQLKQRNSEREKINDFNFIEIDNIKSPSDFIRLRAETDSSALKKNFVMKLYIKKTFLLTHHQNLFTTLQKKYVMRPWGEKCSKVLRKIFRIIITT